MAIMADVTSRRRGAGRGPRSRDFRADRHDSLLGRRRLADSLPERALLWSARCAAGSASGSAG